MQIFRPMNSEESNLFKIRLSIGFGSTLGVFDTNSNTLINGDIIASNNSSQKVTKDYLSSPTNNLLPTNFVLKYTIDGSTCSFDIVYGKSFTQQPSITIQPHTSLGNVITSNIIKKSLTDTLSNLSIHFSEIGSSITNSIPVSPDGSTGLLGFDLEITGPIKLGITTGNSNKGWALTNDNKLYTYHDASIGTSLTTTDSFVLGKNLNLVSTNGTIKTYTFSTSTLDYSTSVWLIDGGVELTTVTPKVGMVLIISSTNTAFIDNTYSTNPTVQLNTGCTIDYTTNNLITFSSQSNSIILYGISTTAFILLNSSTGVSLSTN